MLSFGFCCFGYIASFSTLYSSRKLLIGIAGEFLRTSNKKKQEHLFAVLFKNLLTIAFTLSPFHHFFSKLGNGSREDVTGSRKRWSWCLSADLFLFPLARHGCSLCTPFSHGFSGTAPSFVGPRVVTPYHVAWQDILDGVEW